MKEFFKNCSVQKKIWLGVALVFLLFLAIYPYFLGNLIESKLSSAVDELQKQADGKNMSLKLEFKRSYFSSAVNGQLVVRGGLGAWEHPLNFKIESSVSNMLGTLNANLQLDQGQENKLTLAQFLVQPQLDFKCRVTLTGGLEARLEIVPFKTVEHPAWGWNLDFKGFKANANLSKDFIPSLVELTLVGLTLKEELRIRKFEDAGLVFRLDRGLATVDTSLEFFFDKYDDFEQNFGPGIIEFKVKKLDSNSLAKIKNLFTEINDASGNASPEDLKMKMMMSGMGIFSNLIKHSPSIEVSQLKLRTKNGDLLASARVDVKGDSASWNPLAMLNNIGVVIDGTAPRTVVDNIAEQLLKASVLKKIKDESGLKGEKGEQIMKEATEIAKSKRDDKIKELLENKYIVTTKEGLGFHFEMKNGSMILNEKPFSLKL